MHNFGTNTPRYMGVPVQLNWMGWETDTEKLTRHGWELSANQNVYDNSMQIAIRKEHYGHTIHGFSNLIDFDYFRRSAIVQDLQMQVQLAQNIYLQYMNGPPNEWSAIDGRRSIQTMQSGLMDDVLHFAKINQDTPEIILQRASLEEVLQFALNKQEPRQAEIRQEMMHRREVAEYQQTSELQAKLSLAL